METKITWKLTILIYFLQIQFNSYSKKVYSCLKIIYIKRYKNVFWYSSLNDLSNML